MSAFSNAEQLRFEAALRQAEQDAVHDLVRADPYFFSKYMFMARRRYKWRHNWHHPVVAAALLKVYRGETRRLIINEPPRYSKTQQAVEDFVAWSMGNVPDAEFIHTSYSARLAIKNSYNTKRTLMMPEYRAAFPDTILSNDSKAKDEWRTTAGGCMYATGSGGSLTGYGAGKMREGFGGAIIIDDPHKPGEVTSDVMRQNVIDWFSETVESRGNADHTPIILIMQRLHEEDLSGYLLNGGNGEHWEHVCIPAISPEGEALWPLKHKIEKLRAMEAANPYVFAGQYMQRPAPLGGGIYKDAWWRYWTGWEHRQTWPSFTRIVQSWDTAFKDKQQNDYSVCTTWGEGRDGYYVIDILKGKWQSPELRELMKNHAARFSPNALLVEDKASGQSMIQELQRNTRLPVIAIQKDKDKVQCANDVVPLVQAGKVFLPSGHPETSSYVTSHSQFPNAKHDDDVDSGNQALKYMSGGIGGMTKIPLGGH